MADIKKLEVPGSLLPLGEAFREAGHELYLVGGYVRDRLLGGVPPEIDATTDARPKEIKRLLGPRTDHLWTVGERFGTIGAMVGGFAIEVTSYRTDLYTQGSRHPEVRFSDSLEEDLARRDFTINAVAADALTGEVLDPFDGRRDLQLGIIRAVGGPLERMRDDPLRMLRAVRFQTTLSRSERPFAMTRDLEDAIRENARWLESISAERKREEFEKILVSDNVASGLRALVRLGLMPYVVHEFMETVDVEQEAEFHHKDVFEHTMIVVSSVEPDPVLRKAAFAHLVVNHMRPMSYATGRDPWTDAAVRRFVRDTYLARGDRVLANVDMLLKLARADITGSAPRRRRVAEESWRSLKGRVDEVRTEDAVEKLESPLSGNDLMRQFDRGPGRWIKGLKDFLQDEVVEGRLGKDDKDKARLLAEAYARERAIFEE